MDKDTIREFNKVFEEDYICARIRRVYESLEANRYEQAIDYLNMIQDKAKAAVSFIEENKKGAFHD